MIPLSTLVSAFLRIGLLSFGGPAAQIALMHRELVEQRGWLTEAEFLRALSLCMLLPGPEAMQLATYAGWKLRGIPGGLIAGGLFVGPGALVILVLAFGYLSLGQLPGVQALFLGVKATVVVIVIEAILRVARRALKARQHWVIACTAFVALFVFRLPFPLVIAVAALWGFVTTPRGAAVTSAPLGLGPPLRVLAVGSLVWAAPVALAALLNQKFLVDLGLFFAKLAVVTFGGAYAVLAYMTQSVVSGYGWLTTGQMMDALGLAETTPGPLILVTQFVGIVAGAQQGGVTLGLLSGLMVLWVTFVPCFMWIFAGAPLIGWLEGRQRLTGALAAITAAVVGVITNLSVWFAAHVFFRSVGQVDAGPIHLLRPTGVDPLAFSLAVIAALLIFWRHLSLPVTLAVMAALSVGWSLLINGL